MPKGNPQPWLRRFRGRPPCWYVQLGGRQVRLSEDREKAFQAYHRVMLERRHEPQAARPVAVSADPLVAELLEHFLGDVEANNAAGTYALRRRFLRSFVLHAGVSLPASRLTCDHVQRWLASHPSWGPSTRRAGAVSVKRALAHAARAGLIATSPVAAFRAPAAGRREAVLDQAEFDLLLSRAGDVHFRDLLAFCWETGCRPQEARAAEVFHLDAECSRVQLPLAKSKGGRDRRVILLNAAAAAIAVRARGPRAAGPLFTNAGGRAWTQSAVTCAFSRVQLREGLPLLKAEGWRPDEAEASRLAASMPKTLPPGRRLTAARRKLREAEARHRVARRCLYDLRHSYATRSLKGGVSVAALAQLMGHKNPTMVLNVYQHVGRDEGYLRREMEKLG